MDPRLSATLLRLADAVSAAPTLDGIYAAALTGLRDATGIERASILLFDDDGVMRFKAWNGLSDVYRSAVDGHSPWSPRQDPPDPIVVADVQRDPSLSTYAGVFAAEQIASLAFVPIVSRRQVIGKFMLYRGEPTGFAEPEISAASAIGYQIGFAVERARKELESEQHHARLLFALDAAQMGTWEYDLVAQRVHWSDNLERIHGLPPGTFTGDFASYEREIHPEDRDLVLASLRRAMTEGAAHDVEYRIVAPDGTMRWVNGKGRVERNAAGESVRMSGVCMDITARKQAELDIENALRQEAEVRDRLNVLTRGSHHLLTLVDADNVVDAVLALAREVVPADAYAVWRRRGQAWRIAASHGLSDEFAAMETPHDSTIVFDAPVIAEDVQVPSMLEARRAAYERDGIQALVSIPLTVRHEAVGAIVFYYRAHHRPREVELRVASALGHLSAAAISNARLHAQQQELRLQAQLAETRAVFLGEASVLLSSLDYEDNLRRLAELTVPSLGDWCAVDLLKDGALARLAVAHRDPEKLALAGELAIRYPTDLDAPTGLGQVLRTGTAELYSDISDAMLAAAAVDEEHLRLLRTLGLQSAMIVPLSVSGRTFGAITFVSSTPERRYTERDLAFATELARRAAMAIENARLYREASEANRIKDEFLATLSHELRTPLNVIVGRAHMIKDAGNDRDVLSQTADTIERNGRSLARLVEDLLDVSRFALGQVKLDAQPVDLSTVTATVAAGLEPAARAKGIALNVSAVPDLPELLGDATRLQQVVWNLVTNAIKFTPAGGVVDVSLASTGTEVILTVRDNGEGIRADFLPHVFETFRQGEGALNRRHGGLGLGLSIVRRLVELHGGGVSVESGGLGQGSTFRVALPCMGARAQAGARGEAARALGQDGPASVL